MRIPNALAVALAMISLAAAASLSLAQVPEQMNYQVMLTDNADQPLADQSVQLVFRIYSQVSGGSALWTETQNVTTNSIGVVSVVLGSVTPLTIAFSGPRWLEIQVGAEVMTPRRPLVAAPFALQADNADNLGGTAAASYPLATTLSTAGTINQVGNPVDWTKLKSVPAGFADGVDNTGGGGGGWVDDGTSVRLETATDKVGIGTASPQYSLHVVNPSTTAGARAIYGVASPMGNNWNLCGVYGENATTASGGGGAGVCGLASGAGAATIGVYGYSTSANGYAGYFTNEPGTGYAGYFSAGKTYFGDRVGIGTTTPTHALHVEDTTAGLGSALYVHATQHIAVLAESGDAGGWGVSGKATHSSGINMGVRGETSSPNGYAGFFTGGKNYFGGSVGIGTTDPTARLCVVGNATISDGAPGVTLRVSNDYAADETYAGAAEFNSSSLSGAAFTVLSRNWGNGCAGLFAKQVDDDNYVLRVHAISPSSEGLFVYGTIVSTALSARAVPTSRGTEAVFGVSADEVEVMASGSGRLSGGAARVEFSQLFAESISGQTDLRITATPIGAWSALYVERIDGTGFDLRSGEGDKSVEFHWVAVGRARDYAQRPEITIPHQEEEARFMRERQAAMTSPGAAEVEVSPAIDVK